MENLKNEVNLTTFSQNINEEVDKVVENIFNEKEKKRLNSPIIKYLVWIIAGAVLFFLIGLIFLGLVIILVNAPVAIYITVLFICLIVSVVLFGLYWFYSRSINKITNYFRKPEHIEKFYKYYSELFYPKIIIHKIDKYPNFENNFVTSRPYRHFTNVYLHGTYEDYNLSIGTQTFVYKHIKQSIDGKRNETYYEYIEHLYVMNAIDNIDFETQISPENMATRIFKSKKDKANALESQEFEKLFKLEYSEPIKLRKLLAPRVMAKMIDLAKEEKIPQIYLKNDHIFLHTIVNRYTKNFISKEINTNYFVNLNQTKVKNLDDVKEMLKNTISADFAKINKILNWVSVFQLHKKYEIQQFK